MTADLSKMTDLWKVMDLLQGAVTPRPIALASTIDSKGVVNLSPFSFFNLFSTHPPILIFSPSRRIRDNTTKHTLENILETMEVVIHIVNYDMVQQVSLASTEYPKGINEFIKAGFTEIPSVMVRPPRVKESPVAFECRVQEVKPLGKEGGAGNLVICEVLMVHADDAIFDAKGRIDPAKLDAVCRLGGNYYARISRDNVFEVPKPLMTIGIGIDRLPPDIRTSPILSGNHLGRLANVEKIPSQEEVRSFMSQYHPDGAATLKGDERRRAIHRQARTMLDNGRLEDAWLLLMSITYQLEPWN